MSVGTSAARVRGQPAACSKRGRGGGTLRCHPAQCGFRAPRRFWAPRSGTARRYQQHVVRLAATVFRGRGEQLTRGSRSAGSIDSDAAAALFTAVMDGSRMRLILDWAAMMRLTKHQRHQP